MNDITSRLRHRVEVYIMEKFENELGEEESKEKFLKMTYCDIIPQNSSVKLGQANTESNEHSFKFIFREKSIREIKKDWFFIYENQKYEILYFNRDFKDNQFIEVFCKRVEE